MTTLRTRYSTVTIGPEDDGIRLDVFLARKFMRSRSSVHKRLKGQVLNTGGKTLKWSHHLKYMESIRIGKLEVPEPLVEVRFCILYQDECILVVDKGPGAPVHPSRSWRERTILSHLIKQTHNYNLKPVHRLDRETSGVLIFAKTAAAANNLMNQFRRRTISKRYLAIINGKPSFESYTVDAPLSKDCDFPISCRMRVDPLQGLPSTTELETILHHQGKTLLVVVPKTGRQHQIRVHLAHLGYPVLGDKLYREQGEPYLKLIRDNLDNNDLERLGHYRQALHAESIGFIHPTTNTDMLIRAPLPEDLQKLLGYEDGIKGQPQGLRLP